LAQDSAVLLAHFEVSQTSFCKMNRMMTTLALVALLVTTAMATNSSNATNTSTAAPTTSTSTF